MSTGGGGVDVQVDITQEEPAGQAVTQDPQWAGSDVRSKHPDPVQQTAPAAQGKPSPQRQLPATQLSPAPQTFPHAPQ
jgi:hypothetical protein